MDAKYIEVTTTVSTEEQAEQIARIIVSRKLVACAQIVGPINSSYWWDGRMENAEEWRCVFKTTRDFYPRIEKDIRELHDYEVPEIIAVPIIMGLDDYLKWIDQEVGGTEDKLISS